MNSRKTPMETKDLVWRMSEATPQGEWIDKNATLERRPATDSAEITFGSWFSSFDLQDGVSVSEDADTVPGELFDELFKPAPRTR